MRKVQVWGPTAMESRQGHILTDSTEARAMGGTLILGTYGTFLLSIAVLFTKWSGGTIPSLNLPVGVNDSLSWCLCHLLENEDK
jgi:hypothetical protein